MVKDGWLPGLCAGLHAAHSAGAVAAQQLLDLAWEWLGQDIGTGLASSPSYRDKQLSDLGKPLASVLTAAAAIGAASIRDAVSGYIRQQGGAVTALEMSALRAAAKQPPDGTRGDDGFGELAADCAARLRARLARPQRASGDWSIELPAGDRTCDLCDTLRVFLEDPNQRALEWPLAKQRRQHVHARIDTAELPVSHVTRRQGRPYTLLLNKTDALRRKAEAEHRSMQQVALAAIDAYVQQATPARRQSVPATELMTVFHDLPPMSAEALRADQDRYADAEAYFDAYERTHEPEDGK